MRRLLLVVTFLTIASPSFGAVIYNQPRIFPTGVLTVSENSAQFGGIVQIAFDSFILGSTATIDEVGWAGGYFSPAGTSQAINGFTITFYDNNGGVPGTVLQTNVITGNAGETAAGTDNQGNLNFTYDALLSSSFTATAGTRYWMSIVASVTNSAPFWGWRSATGGDNRFLANQPNQNANFNQGNTDLAFSLISNPAPSVPEPSTITLAATSTLALITLRRRKARLA